MTDVMALSRRQFKRIEWQIVPQDMGQEEISEMIAEGIRELYVMTGRALEFSEDKFEVDDGGLYVSFADDIALDEVSYVLTTAEMMFYKKVQSDVTELTSYTTDGMSVSHGDKPFANLQTKIEGLEKEKRMIWYKMTRYHML